MRLHDLNWIQLESYLASDDRVVLPLGSTEQHAQLSLGVDAILAERVALDAAEPLGIPVLPVVPYGIAPYFTGYPGTISLRVETYLRLVGDVLDNLERSGFRRVLIVNGHGGNAPAAALATEWAAGRPAMRIRFHNWWNAPRTRARVQDIDPVASHASWMENFPWTRLSGVRTPEGRKPMIDRDRMSLMSPEEVRSYLGDGNFGGVYEKSDEEMLALWAVAVQETRALLETWS